MAFWPLTISDLTTSQTFHQFHDIDTDFDLYRIMSGFYGAFATDVACQQGTLTFPDTWFRPPMLGLLVLQLLRPDSWNLSCLYSTFHLEYPLVLSRFCLKYRGKLGVQDICLLTALGVSRPGGVLQGSYFWTVCVQAFRKAPESFTPPDTWSRPILGLAYVLLVEANPFPEHVVIFLDYALRTSRGPFSILLLTMMPCHNFCLNRTPGLLK